jgi:hypothetical protein
MKLKSLVLAAALLPAFGSAYADNFDVTLVGGPQLWSAHLGATHTTGNFSDTFTFTNYSAASGTVWGSLINNAGWSDVDFTSATLNGVDVSTADLGPLSILAIFGQDVTGPLTLVVNGTVTGAVASYGGEVSVSAVPEPSTYGMLIGGMGVLAFLARRRKQQ